jgi:ferric-dicitrate binding protein FerR (iron transport regulator)
MMADTERIRYLLEHRLAGDLTATEKRELALVLQDAAQETGVQEQLQLLMENSLAGDEIMVSRWDKNIAAVLDADKGAAPRRIPVYKKYGWIAAAAVIIVLAGSVYIWRMAAKQPPVAAIQPESDVAPGGNKATLTLAGGKRIVLDSAANGSIAQQGNVNIVKLNNGQLVYNLNGNAGEVWMNTMTTPVGGQYQLTLPDGTKVWLNAASSITYPSAFAGANRNVSITGEAYFEVAKDIARPFIVNVNNESEIKVLGTHFNVNAYTDETAARTTLLEGSVNVSVIGPSLTGIKSAILKPGEQAVVADNSPLTIDHSPDVEQAVAWKNGRFNFNGADLHTVMRQLTRWYGINVKYEGNVTDEIFQGELTRDLKLSQVLRILGKMEIKFRIEGKTLVVIP